MWYYLRTLRKATRIISRRTRPSMNSTSRIDSFLSNLSQFKHTMDCIYMTLHSSYPPFHLNWNKLTYYGIFFAERFYLDWFLALNTKISKRGWCGLDVDSSRHFWGWHCLRMMFAVRYTLLCSVFSLIAFIAPGEWVNLSSLPSFVEAQWYTIS